MVPADAEAGTFPVPGGDYCLKQMSVSVQPSGVGGLLSLSLPGNLQLYNARDKSGGPLADAEWNLSLGDAAPASLFLGGTPVPDQPPGQAPTQTVSAALTFPDSPGSGGSGLAALQSNVNVRLDGSAAASKASLEVYPFHPYQTYYGNNNAIQNVDFNDTPDGMTEAIVLHLILGADEYVNPHTYSTSVRVEETSYQYPSDFACYCDLSFGPTRNGYSDGFYNGETFLETYDDQTRSSVFRLGLRLAARGQPAGIVERARLVALVRQAQRAIPGGSR